MIVKRHNMPTNTSVYVRRPIRSVLATVLILMAPFGNGASENTYVIIKATVLPAERVQPTWISLCPLEGECFHVAAEGPIVSIDAGAYDFQHIDFGDDESSGTRSIEIHQLPRLAVEAGNIHIYGHITVDMTSKRNSRTSLEVDMALLRSACEANPGIFESYPVVNAHNGKKGKFSCDLE